MTSLPEEKKKGFHRIYSLVSGGDQFNVTFISAHANFCVNFGLRIYWWRWICDGTCWITSGADETCRIHFNWPSFYCSLSMYLLETKLTVILELELPLIQVINILIHLSSIFLICIIVCVKTTRWCGVKMTTSTKSLVVKSFGEDNTNIW